MRAHAARLSTTLAIALAVGSLLSVSAVRAEVEQATATTPAVEVKPKAGDPKPDATAEPTTTADATKTNAPKTDATKTDATKTDATKTAATKTAATKTAATKTAATKTDATTTPTEDATASTAAKVEDEPDNQSLIYFNARIAARERRHKDVIKLWMVKNALESRGEIAEQESDFRSIMWASLASAGLCHDGLRDDTDEGGAGIWPLGLHNWISKSSSRQEAPAQPRAFTSFGSGFHQRLFSVHDVLSVEEMKGIRFFRRNCRRAYIALAQLPTVHWLDMSDRLSRGIFMRDLLEKAQKTMKRDRVRGQVVLETRLFDLDLALVRLAKIKARQEGGLIAGLARDSGVSEDAIVLVREERLAKVRARDFARLLRNALDWDLDSWLALALKRRIALFREAQLLYRDEPSLRPKLHRTMLRNLDAAIATGDGTAINMWLGFANFPTGDAMKRFKKLKPRVLLQLHPTVREARLEITEGERGEKLLALEPSTRFRERSTVALRRGIAALSRGESLLAMRSFALAMKLSEESRTPDAVHRLTKRWFAYVLSQYTVNDEVLAILNTFVSPIDRNELLAVLLWRAAFFADKDSFEKIALGVRRGGSIDRQVVKLRFLANGDVTALMRHLRLDLKKRPNAILRFLKQLTSELATEALDVRENNRVVMDLAMELLGTIADGGSRGLARRANEQIEQMQTLLDGLSEFDDTPIGRARSAAPGAEAYAGTVRLAPADAIPWPFGVSRAVAPSPFSPVKLTPVEWREKDGTIVFGWQVHE